MSTMVDVEESQVGPFADQADVAGWCAPDLAAASARASFTYDADTGLMRFDDYEGQALSSPSHE